MLAADRAAALGVRPMARVLGVAAAGVDPHVMGIGVVPAVRRLLERTARSASRTSTSWRSTRPSRPRSWPATASSRFDPERLNVNGGAIALGHPIGATGARIAVTLLHEMARRRVRRGLATLCISGGMGLAAAFEAV